jgi:hypothetical protein
VQGRRTEQGNCTVVCNLPLDLDLPEIVASSGGGLCVGCEAEMTSRSEGAEWRVSGRQEEFSRRVPDFILTDGFGLWCTGDAHHWLPWAAVRDGTVC